MKTLTLAALLLLAGAAAAHSQEPLVPGDRIRVTWDDGGWASHGFRTLRSASLELLRIDAGHIVGRRGGTTVVVSRGSIMALERRVGTKPASAPAMVIGSAGGFVVGFLGGVFKASVDPTVNGAGDVMDSGMVTGVLFGAPIGAIVAWGFSRSRGIYEPVGFGGIRPTLVVSPTGATGLSLSIGTR